MNKNAIDSTQKYEQREDFVHYSVSKIKTYKQCSQMYKYRYVDKLNIYKISTATLIGTILHATLEYLYGEEAKADESIVTAVDAFYSVIIPTLIDAGIKNAEAILQDLLSYNADILQLYQRASPEYRGIDAIRTKAGEVPKAPEMTGVWKQECKKLRLDDRKKTLDICVNSISTELEKVSITEVFSKAFNIAANYVTPPEIHEILYLELPLSRWSYTESKLYNPIKFPGCLHENIYLNGYIDLVCKLNINGKIVNAVVDYKTSKEEFTKSIVEHNQQLLVYAKAAELLLNIDIEYIAILSFLQSRLIYTPVNKEVQDLILINYNNVINNSLNISYIKHVPDSKYSPCLNSFKDVCPFLENCWPSAYNLIVNNVEPEFNYEKYLLAI